MAKTFMTRFLRGRRNPTSAALGSVEEAHDPGDGLALGDALSLARRAEMQEADRLLVVTDLERPLSGGLIQDRHRAPVPGEAASVCAEQHNVGSHAAREKVLLVLDRVTGLAHRYRDERRSTVELPGRAGLGSFLDGLEPLAGCWTDHPKAPRVRQMVIGRPASEVEELFERCAIDRLGPVSLVRAARADRLFELHERRVGAAGGTAT